MDFFALSEELKKSFDELVKKKDLIQEDIQKLNGQKANLELELKRLQKEISIAFGKKLEVEKAIREKSAIHNDKIRKSQAELEKQQNEWIKAKAADEEALKVRTGILDLRDNAVTDTEQKQDKKSHTFIEWEKELDRKSKANSAQAEEIKAQAEKNRKDSQFLAAKRLEMATLEKNAKEAIKTIEEVKIREATLSKNEAEFAVTKKLYDDRMDKLVQKEAVVAQEMQSLEKEKEELRREKLRLEDREKTLQSNLTNFTPQ